MERMELTPPLSFEHRIPMLISSSCLIEMRGAPPSADSDILSLVESSGVFGMLKTPKGLRVNCRMRFPDNDSNMTKGLGVNSRTRFTGNEGNPTLGIMRER